MPPDGVSIFFVKRNAWKNIDRIAKYLYGLGGPQGSWALCWPGLRLEDLGHYVSGFSLQEGEGDPPCGCMPSPPKKKFVLEGDENPLGLD